MSEFVRLKMAEHADRQLAATRSHLLLEGSDRSAADDLATQEELAMADDPTRAVGARLAGQPPQTTDPRPESAIDSAEAAATIAFDPAAAAVQLRARQLKKNYRKGPVDIPVLTGTDLELRRGEFLAIIGQSGSGKSTLLHLLGTLDAPTSGEVHLDGRRIDNLPAAQRDILRNTRFGMIFQFYHLLPELTTLENVLSPLMIRYGFVNYWRRRRQHVAQARELLEMVGLSHRLKHRPRELSGGEMQRTAIARALISGPQILLADEPTGNLDQASGEGILEILRTLNQSQKLSIVMVTHDPAIAAEADRVVRLVAGRIEEV
jgi:lipoprotein-releasing system ATP-binding protein